MNIQVNRKTFEFLMQLKKRKLFLVGGAGSGKSYAIAQHLILNKLVKEKNIRILVTRKTLPSLRASAYLLFMDLIKKYKIPHVLNKSELTLKVSSSTVMFKGLDDPEKIKSADFNYIWGEEATDFNHADYMQLNLRLRRKNDNAENQCYFSFNPVDELSFLKKTVEMPSDEMAVNYTTYKDNAFLGKEYIKEIENLKNQDETYYKIYALGQWATPKNIVYTNWDIIEELPEAPDETIYGLDFGYNNPTALVRILAKDQEYYEEECLYDSELTNEDLIQLLRDIIPNKNDCIYADCAEPNRIEEIKRAGYNIHPSDKSVKDGIDFVKRAKIHIHKNSANLIKEKRSYKWKEDKDGNVLDEPLKYADHIMDAERYALYTHFNKPELSIRFM